MSICGTGLSNIASVHNVHTLRDVPRKNALLRQTDCHKATSLFSLSHALILKILDQALTLCTSANMRKAFSRFYYFE
jgi:hypothetical protein